MFSELIFLSLLEDFIVFATLDEMMIALRSDMGDCHEAPPKSHAWELAIGLYKTSPHKNMVHRGLAGTNEVAAGDPS